MTVRVLSSGVDSLYLSAQGGLRADVLSALEAARVRAEHERDLVPIAFEREPWTLLVRPYGYRGYRYWLTSPEVEVWLGRTLEGPAARVQLHSAFLHAAGTVKALTAVEGLLDDELFTWPAGLSVSRVDMYADVQGWAPVPGDMARFVSKANHRELHVVGREFTGFVFGRTGGVLARIYDKTAQMRESGLSWMRAYWRGHVEGEPVWRVEFQVRGPLLRRLRSWEPDAVLAMVPGLWRYCTESWLTLRMPSAHAVSARWPIDPVWIEVRGLGGVQAGGELVWREVEAASEERVLAVLQGSWTSWAAMWGLEDPERAARALVLRVGRYLAKKDRTFGGEVRRKRVRLAGRGVRRAVLSRRVGLGPKAQEKRIVTSDRPFGADGPGGTRVRQSTALVRPEGGPGEAAGGHEHGREEDGRGHGDGGCPTAAVGVEPPTQPERHKPNRSRGGWVGTARQRGGVRRGGAPGRARSESGRRRGGRRSVSSEGPDGTGAP